VVENARAAVERAAAAANGRLTASLIAIACGCVWAGEAARCSGAGRAMGWW
jgi:hypothetical protein